MGRVGIIAEVGGCVAVVFPVRGAVRFYREKCLFQGVCSAERLHDGMEVHMQGGGILCQLLTPHEHCLELIRIDY